MVTASKNERFSLFIIENRRRRIIARFDHKLEPTVTMTIGDIPLAPPEIRGLFGEFGDSANW